MTAPNGTNGQHKILWWIVGALLAPIVLAVFGHMLDTTYTDSQKISAVEAVLHEVQLHIDRVERKLDQLLDRR